MPGLGRLILGVDSTKVLHPISAHTDGDLIVDGHGGGSIFHYANTLMQHGENTALPAGTSAINLAAVPARFVYVYTNLIISYVGTVPLVTIAVYLVDGANVSLLYAQHPPVSGQGYDRQGYWVLKPTQNLQYKIFGATLNDDAYIDATGFQMNV